MAETTSATPARKRVRWLRDYGPTQLRDLLELTEWQMERLRDGRWLGRPDIPRGRWSQDQARRLYRRRKALAERAGNVPDVGAFRVSEYLEEKLGIDQVSADAVRELARLGHLKTAGWYKSNRLYCGRTLETFAALPDARQVVVSAEVTGRMVRTEEVVDYLGVRPVDVKYLVDKGYLRHRGSYRGQWSSTVVLYRAGDLQDLLADERFDWEAARAVPAGNRSPFAKLPPVPERK